MKKLTVVSAFIGLLGLFIIALPQIEKSEEQEDKYVNCEELIHLVTKAIYHNEGDDDEKTYLFFILRQGENESRKFTKARVNFIAKFIKFRGYLTQSVIAVGAKSKGDPKMEIYSRGKLMETVIFKKKDKNICDDDWN